MHVGLLTSPFGKDADFAHIAAWAGKAGFAALEVQVGHIDPAAVLAGGDTEINDILASNGLSISSFAFYSWFGQTGGREGYLQAMRQIIRAAGKLGVSTVCPFAGMPESGKSKAQTITEDLPAIFGPLAAEAADLGVKLAFENWFETNLQHLEHFRLLCEALPQANVGFNFDPSHLHWQGIDVLGAVAEFGSRIFHTHAKDVTIFPTKLARLGVKEYGWWEYSIPGYGAVPWGPYLRALRRAGYDGVLSIEHEDPAFGVEEGFSNGLRYLSQYI